ncbi:hypothetical protein LB450_03505 [Psychroflexus sp. CAK1W]|uniref:hypothetical protein n=1 Tax=Psychroflexus curvus TaxID=2873595 RepID=UPI001CCF3539|nr:hypothetical protein [Psychroflexus curvus]MBZ9627161.1 hypothetical protein [Psychroflexus curvus]
MSKGFTGFGLTEDEFREMIREVIVDELGVFIEKMQEVKLQPTSRKEMLTRQEVIDEYKIGSTRLYNLKKENKLVPKNFEEGRRDYYFREDLDKHFK